MKIKKPIRNITSLEREIYRLELESRRLEDKIGDNYKYLKSNFPSLIAGSAFRYATGKSVKWTILESIWKNEKVQDGVQSVVANVSERFAAWVKKKFGKR
jgi:hypothetical protein